MVALLFAAVFAVVSADLVYIQGGFSNGGSPQQLLSYNTATSSFTTLTGGQTGTIPPSNRNLGRSAVYYSGRVYVFGGCDSGSLSFSNDLYSWNPINNEWTNMNPPDSTFKPSPRCYHSAVYDSSLQIMLVYGGMTGPNAFSGVVFAYQFSTNTWINFISSGTGANLPPSRCAASAVYNPTLRSMYIYGGYSTDAQGVVTRYTGLFKFEVQTISAGVWTVLSPTGNLPLASDSHCAVFIPTRNAMLIYGGGSTSTNTNSMYQYNFGTNAWSQIVFSGLNPFSLRGHTCYFDEGTFNFFSIGGSSSPYTAGVPSTAAVQRIDLATNTVNFVTITGPPGGFMYAAAVGVDAKFFKISNVSAVA